ncbi:OMPdecase-domain-containing protein [Tilletiopsis washingtonensis]|uniref:Orotidine 5'-phosphate decarboxylase n=1 Tax=Tilletiopsis washingtonensis TaxID=58919 RepID=A0A316ZC73_9BASI|nr:OMPdecase-domain-containing protein [Tilletiopsis washingtonensis]PWN99129.1 OMPdecase-domain-containing protein [Tilletiopsis washingtonensis]
MARSSPAALPLSSPPSPSAMSVAALRYEARAEAYAPASAARALLATMVRKRSNLCVSVDVTRAADLLAVVAAVAPHVCLVKTHIDIVSDFSDDLVVQLQALAQQHDFLIFEDRKFADIGNTVSLQYAAGVHKIASWSHITNAHLVPGPGIIDGLAAVGEPLGRSLLLLAEMSSAGTLARGEYSRECVRAAYAHPFVCGFIAMHRVDDDEAPPAGQAKKDFLILTPGVGLDSTGDGRGQQYRTPDEVVRASGCDVIIVGRGIYGALLKEGVARADAIAEVTRQGERYRDAGWQAYEARLGA